MKRNLKKILTIVLTIIMIANMGLTAFANTGTENDVRLKLFNEEMRLRQNDEQFQMHYNEDPQGAIDMINIIVDNNMRPTLRAGNLTNAWVLNAPLIKQKNDYYCGPTSALQAILGYNKTVTGADYNAKQDTLATAMETNADVGTYVYKLTNVLNNYTSGNYSYKAGSSLTYDKFKTTISNSVMNDKCPILHARTKYISYYEGANYGHYICLTAINNDPANPYDRVQLKDCINVTRFHGTRSIPMTEAYNSITESGRYLISANMQ